MMIPKRAGMTIVPDRNGLFLCCGVTSPDSSPFAVTGQALPKSGTDMFPISQSGVSL